MKRYFVYILSSGRGVLYTGVTNDLTRRVNQHRIESGGLTHHYRVGRLVYWEEPGDIRTAIARERQIKGWTRSRKLDLVRTANPSFRDLSDDLQDQHP
ncbi:MAG: hypothetical protein A2Z37_03905 [Chloroflexi bacterium RBG_19FT_COMBO_62_14]|nr:MAG: hypothetical protein A2Z37_03905 [Chloroflexi bacterium RBG_19FT_COMBO_62_14]